jgi:peptidoglycan/xylan/chitin deacetylase (PgdA/CDA1 family)
MTRVFSTEQKKTFKRGILQVSRLSGLTALGRALTRSGFRIIGFHGVSIEDEHVRFPTLFISPDSFERRLQFLTRKYQIVSLDEAMAQHRAGQVRPNQVVLTFDDGFYNFLSRAIPILQKYGAHGTIYVVTSEVESGEPVFNLLAKDIILSTRHRSARGLPHAPETAVDLDTVTARHRAADAVVNILNATCDTREKRYGFVQSLAAALDVNVEAKLRARLWHLLTPAEVCEVAAAGFGVQLHTHSHRNVVSFRERVRDEVRTNRDVLERLTGTRPLHFCYPLGLWERSVWPDLTAEGVQTAVTTRNGPNYSQTPALALRRYLTGEAMSALEFEFELSGVRWLASTAFNRQSRFSPSEKRLRYSEQPELY